MNKPPVLLLGFLMVCAPSAPQACSFAESQTVSSSDRDEPLTLEPGNPEHGRLAFVDRDRGHCILCHALSRSPEPFQGTLGPTLDGISVRLDAAQIRFRIIDASRLNPETVMPPYFRVHDLSQVAAEFSGKPVLTSQEVEDVVAFLQSIE